jgi:hypothetical protein
VDLHVMVENSGLCLILPSATPRLTQQIKATPPRETHRSRGCQGTSQML